MKNKLLLLFLIISALSCGVYRPPYQETMYVGDFRNYTLEGFIITPATTGFEYEPIATIAINGGGISIKTKMEIS